MHTSDATNRLEALIHDVPDFPKQGVVYKDFSPLLADPGALALAVELMANPYRGKGVNLVIGAESRGFIFGTAIAQSLSAGFVPIRKPGKLPRAVHGVDYALEYGTDRLEIHQDALPAGAKILLVDDLLATGGTMRASCELVSKASVEIMGITVLIELGFLGGAGKLSEFAPRPLGDPVLMGAKMGESAVYAGSFDPPTNGHVWMIQQGARLFDRLIVAAARNPEKGYTYELDTRLGWLNEICSAFDNVEIASLENEFLAHYANRADARFVIRGIRNEADYQYERGMRYVNSDLNEGLTTVFLMPPRELCEISSSFVKGMIGPEGWEPVVQRYLPTCVFEDLRDRQ